MEDFYLLPVGDRLMQYDRLAVNTVVATWDEGIATGDIPISADLERFNQDYRKAHGQVRESGESYELGEDDMVIGTSALSGYEVDSAVNIYAGCYNNPFLIWGQYRKKWLRAPCRCPFSSTTPNWTASRQRSLWSGWKLQSRPACPRRVRKSRKSPPSTASVLPSLGTNMTRLST